MQMSELLDNLKLPSNMKGKLTCNVKDTGVQEYNILKLMVLKFTKGVAVLFLGICGKGGWMGRSDEAAITSGSHVEWAIDHTSPG